ncbi:MAG: helix-turn-helix transcriptional regulator [Truepera sp.]|nr:helix-turn-helix transcriptional regulator [Truepera sp.]
MSTGKLELKDLGRLVMAERNRRGMSLREAATDTGIPFNTLARVEKGHLPDLSKFKRLVEWCGADIKQFFEIQEKAAATTDLIAELLRADRNLPPEAAERIAGIVDELYRALARPQEVSAVHLRAAKTFRPEAARALGLLLNDLNDALLEESTSGAAERI